MKNIFLLAASLCIVTVLLLVSQSEAIYCPCDLSRKEPVCGSNGITYKNHCEFECTQRELNKLGRRLNLAKTGPCSTILGEKRLS